MSANDRTAPDRIRAQLVVAVLIAVTSVAACMNPRPHRVRVSGNNCASCHMNDYLDAGVARPPLPDGGVRCTLSHTSPTWYPQKCEFCHTREDWCDVQLMQVRGSHGGTSLPLDVRHDVDAGSSTVIDETNASAIVPQCVGCHLLADPTASAARPVWSVGPTPCGTCHLEIANQKFCAAANGGVGHAQMASALPCESCHDLNGSWRPAVPGLHPSTASAYQFHGGATCQRCHSLDRLRTLRPVGSALAECVDGGAPIPAVPITANYPDCNLNVGCPECTCMGSGCHNVAASAGSHTDNCSARYTTCRSVRPNDLCLNCHFPDPNPDNGQCPP